MPPLDNLLTFFPAESFQQVTFQTKSYHEQSLDSGTISKKWVRIDEEELKSFLSIIIAMGIVNSPDTRSY